MKRLIKYIVTILSAVVLAFTIAGCDDKLPEGSFKFKKEFGVPSAIGLVPSLAEYVQKVVKNNETIEYIYSFVENVVYTKTEELEEEDKRIWSNGFLIAFGYKDGSTPYKDDEIYCFVNNVGKSLLVCLINDTKVLYMSEEGAIEIDAIKEFYETLEFRDF